MVIVRYIVHPHLTAGHGETMTFFRRGDESALRICTQDFKIRWDFAAFGSVYSMEDSLFLLICFLPDEAILKKTIKMVLSSQFFLQLGVCC